MRENGGSAVWSVQANGTAQEKPRLLIASQLSNGGGHQRRYSAVQQQILIFHAQISPTYLRQ